MTDRITIEGRDDVLGVYITRPKVLPAPPVVVLHELFGVNADIRETGDDLVEQGFIAIAPYSNLFETERCRSNRQSNPMAFHLF